MEIGCHLPTQGPLATREALLAFAGEAEKRQVASLWVSDHVVFPRSISGSYPAADSRIHRTSHTWSPSRCSPPPRCARPTRGSARRCSSWVTAIPLSWRRC